MDAVEQLTRLILVRHADAGETRRDHGLSDLGRQQADSLRMRLLRSGELRWARRLVTSDLVRARETAKLIADAVGRSGLEPEPDTSFREMAWGQAEEMSWDDILAQRGGQLVGRRDRVAPDAESWDEFETRATTALRRCAESALGSTVVIVCHTGLIEASFIQFAGLSRRGQRFRMRPRATSLTSWVTVGADSSTRAWRLEGYNDAAHLWIDGVFLHGEEGHDELASVEEPFWAAMD